VEPSERLLVVVKLVAVTVSVVKAWVGSRRTEPLNGSVPLIEPLPLKT
jgi:hypothetical protein